MQGMKVSVVVPTYYRPEDLSELFDSLLMQTVKPLEVIAVDDTPNNTIKAVCEKYEDKFDSLRSKLIYIKNTRERSASISRNLGMKLSRGELIMFLDSDVIIYPDYIQRILEVFRKYPYALGVHGWITDFIGKKFHSSFHQIIRRIFFLGCYTRDSCRWWEYPTVLTRIINCEHLSGANMTLKREVSNEFQFDEKLKKYSWMEDVLLSHSIFQKYPKGLFMTPFGKCVHKISEAGRIEGKELKRLKNKYRKYVLVKLFGLKGAFIYFWQDIGRVIIKLTG